MVEAANTGAGDGSLSIVIPIYNEEAILDDAVTDLLARIDDEPRLRDRPLELILTENGSTDATVDIARDLVARHDPVQLLRTGEPNYGLALRRGIYEATGEIVLCDEIDLCDTDFYVRALDKIEDRGFDLVVGSKALDTSMDHRPAYRQLGTRVLNGMFRVLLDFGGTDTHGLKAFRRQPLLDVARACVVDKDLFASEFVIRAERRGIEMTEIPVRVAEKREPSTHLFERVPNVLKNLGRLVWVIRIANR